MEIASACPAALSMVAGLAIGAAAGWFFQKRFRARAGMPALIVDGEDIVITNILEEELFLVKIAVNVQFALAFKNSPKNQQEREVEHWFRRSRNCRQRIGPKSQARLQLHLKAESNSAVVNLTFDSGLGTLRKARAQVRIPLVAS